MKHNVLIIEDEHFAQKELERLLRLVAPNFNILTFLDSIEDSVAYLKQQTQVDLIFLDIQLSDGLSFEILKA